MLTESLFAANSQESIKADIFKNLEASPWQYGHVVLSKERELRYFSDLSLLSKQIDNLKLESFTIEQYQFNRAERAALACTLPPHISYAIFQAVNATSARIRRTRKNGSYTFVLQTKSPKTPGLYCVRDEPSLDLPEHIFNSLSKLATKGALIKERREITGRLDLGNGQSSEIILHIDSIKAAGLRLPDGSIPAIPERFRNYLILEIEYKDKNHLYSILRGRHPFIELLKNSCMITGDDQLQSLFGSSKLARNGFIPECEQAMQNFLDLQIAGKF